MGGEPYAAMNIVCFPIKRMDRGILREILRGGLDAMAEAGAVLAGGHSVEDEEIKYGLAVSGVVDPGNFASNRGMRPGDALILTKPLGTGVLATALKGDMGDAQIWKTSFSAGPDGSTRSPEPWSATCVCARPRT
jgi:selenide,water dikinase